MAISQLAAERDVVAQPIPTVLLLVRALLARDPNQASAEGVAILREVQRKHPSDFWINYELAECLPAEKLAEEVGFRRICVALRPDSFDALRILARRLQDLGNNAESEAICREAIGLEPENASQYLSLAVTLRAQHKNAEAEEL